MLILKVLAPPTVRTINTRKGPMEVTKVKVEQLGGEYLRQGIISAPRDIELKAGDIVTASDKSFAVNSYDEFNTKQYMEVELLSTALKQIKDLGLTKAA